MAEVVDVALGHLIEGPDAVLLHVAPGELELPQREREGVPDQALEPAFIGAADYISGSPPHARRSFLTR
jgi:hypothetical protein